MDELPDFPAGPMAASDLVERLRRLAREIPRRCRVVARWPLAWNGRTLRDASVGPTWGQVASGQAANPYAVNLAGDEPGATVVGYEVNGVQRLAGGVYRMYPSPAGGWRFAADGVQIALPTTTCTQLVTVGYQPVGCNGVTVPGGTMSVAASGGGSAALVGSGTSAGGGAYNKYQLTPGHYCFTAIPPDGQGWTPGTTCIDVASTCGSPYGISLRYGLQSCYSCLCGGSAGATRPDYPNAPVSGPVYVTDNNGTWEIPCGQSSVLCYGTGDGNALDWMRGAPYGGYKWCGHKEQLSYWYAYTIAGCGGLHCQWPVAGSGPYSQHGCGVYSGQSESEDASFRPIALPVPGTLDQIVNSPTSLPGFGSDWNMGSTQYGSTTDGHLGYPMTLIGAPIPTFNGRTIDPPPGTTITMSN